MGHSVARSLLGTLVLLLASHGDGGAQDVSRMDRIIRSHVDSKQFMGSVLVAQDGKVLLDKGYGSANLEWDIPDSPQTKFRLGSLTKQFTAAAILLLEERGKLRTADLVAKYLPDAPAGWATITIANLLTHTSGIPNFTSFPDYSTTEATPTTPEHLVARFRDKPLNFQPGEKWEYSNSGYVLLGYLLEKISGQRYQDFVRDNLFAPLGMTESGYDSHAAIIRHRASGYAPGANGPVNGGAPGEIARQLMSLLHGEKVVLPSERKEITVSTDVLRQYVGTYQLAPTFSLVITLEGNRLMSQATNQPALPLFPESQTSFFLKAVDAQIEFAKNAEGEVTGLTLRQGGDEMKALKR